MLTKNQHIFGRCTDYTYDGLGVVKYDTFTVFVKDMIVGEEAQIVITLVKKDFAYGKILSLTSPSKERVESECAISKPCGGCQLQHMSADAQAAMKEGQVENVIRKIAKLDNPIEPLLRCATPYGYRNKVMLPVGVDRNGKTVIGFYRYNSHEIIPISSCLLQSDDANRLIGDLRNWIDDEGLNGQIRHIMLRDMRKTEQMMLVIVTYKKECTLAGIVDKAIRNYPNVKSIYQNINGEDTNVVLGKEEKLLYGQPVIQDILCGCQFNISPHSFYQVNSYQTEKLYSKAIELAGLSKEDTVLDLYCGVGTIGLIASGHCKKVIGVEIVEEAVKDGRKNAKLNGIENVELICKDARIAAKELLERGENFDCVFVDPPRKGCSEEALKTLVAFKSRRIIYISCNPSTLARDLIYLKEFYNVETIQPVDMFPNTYHVESVVLLSNKNVKTKDYVEIGADVEDYYHIKNLKRKP